MIAQEGDTLRIEFVDAAGAGSAVAYEAGLFQHAEMLGDGGAGNGKTGGEFVDGAGVGAEHFEDGQAGGIAEGGKAVLYVSVHLR